MKDKSFDHLYELLIDENAVVRKKAFALVIDFLKLRTVQEINDTIN